MTMVTTGCFVAVIIVCLTCTFILYQLVGIFTKPNNPIDSFTALIARLGMALCLIAAAISAIALISQFTV